MSHAPLMVSVSGLRGLVDQSLTPQVAARFAASFGRWLKQQTGKTCPHVILGRDSRRSGPMVELSAASGLLATGCSVTMLGIVTTPSVAIMIDHLRADGGMVATASHNPLPWNGLKPLTSTGVAPPPDQAEDIIRRFRADANDYPLISDSRSLQHDDSSHRVHVDRVLAQVDVQTIRKRKLKVVVDSVHGAGGAPTAMLLNNLGVDLVHLYAEPTGDFPHTPEPTAANLTGLCDAVREHHADVGFAQDPDADRLAIVDEQGRYIGEEHTLALATLRIMQRSPGSAATNLSTSRMIDDVAALFRQTIHRTPVGEANVAARMREAGCVVGGEGNGGVIFPPVAYVRDSLIAMALVLELMADSGKSIAQLVKSIPSYVIVKDKQLVQPGASQAAIDKLARRWAGQKVDRQDGIRLDTAEGWVHVRASNTEPILRLIAEAKDAAAAQRLIDEARLVISK